MSMTILLASIAVSVIGGFLALFLGKSAHAAKVVACLFGMGSALLAVLAGFQGVIGQGACLSVATPFSFADFTLLLNPIAGLLLAIINVLAFAAAMLGADLIVQIVVFLVVSIACLLLLRPVVLKYRARGEAHEATPVGQHAVVVEDIDNAALKGRIETPDHMTWSAVSADGSVILRNARVRVVAQHSIKLVVERM